MQVTEREKALTGLECCINSLFDPCPYHCPYYAECTNRVSFAPLLADVAKLLKEQDGYVSVPFSWLVKFCTHIDFKEPVTDEERELFWKRKLKQQFGIDLEEGEMGWLSTSLN